MTQSNVLSRRQGWVLRPEPVTLSPVVTRLVGVALALSVAAVHVADQGGLTALVLPDWLGWSYRLIEIGGVLVALTLIWPRLALLSWSAGVLLGVGPFAGYLASRTVGVPGDPGDVGNWSDWVGTVGLIVEAGLIVISLGMLWAQWPRPSGVDQSSLAVGHDVPDSRVTRSPIPR